MSAELDLLQKNDVRFTTKQNRHLIMKKSFDNTEYAVSTSGKTDKSTKKSNKNEKRLFRKVEAQKRSDTILNEILKINKRKKMDDDELEYITSESESVTSEDEPVMKKSKSQLQADIILATENKKLKEEVAYYKNISLAQNEAKTLLDDLQSSRTVLDQKCFVCSSCYNVQDHKVQDHNTDYKVDADLSNYHNINNTNKNILNKIENVIPNNNSGDVENIKPNNSDEVENIEPNEVDNTSNEVDNTSNEVDNIEPQNNSENSLILDLGYGVKIHQNILNEKIRKKNERHLLLDLLNALYTKADFASCSRSGKKGKSNIAKPELDTNKQKAIVDYVAEILPQKNKQEIEVLLKKIIENKCKNASKQSKVHLQ